MDHFYWDEATRRYYYDDGTVVPAATIKEWLIAYEDAMRERLRELAEDWIDGRIDEAEFITEAKEEIRDGHRLAAVVAFGGLAAMTAANWGKVGALVREQYQYFNDFVNGTNLDEATAAGLASRAGLYASAIYPTFVASVQYREIDNGATEERSVLNPAEHCDECVEEADRDWVPIGELVPIGDRTCMVNCKCDYETR